MEKEKLSISLKLKTPLITIKRPLSETNTQPLKKIKLNISSQASQEFSLQTLMTNVLSKVSLENKSGMEFQDLQEKIEKNEIKNIKEFSRIFQKSLSGSQEQVQDVLKEFNALLDKNIPNPNDSDLKSLFTAISTRDIKAAEKILKKFPLAMEKMVNCTLFGTPFTWNCLHSACYYGVEKIVKFVLDQGGDIEGEDTFNRARPLGWAAYGGHSELCKILVNEYKADPWAKNIHGQNAFALVADPSHPRWTGIWTKRDDENQESRVKSSESRKSNSKVLLTIPTLGKKEEDEEDLYVTIQPRKAGQAARSMVGQSSSISPRIPRRHVQVNTFGSAHHPISYGNFKIELQSLIKSLGIVSNDEKIKTVYHVESSFFGTILTVPPQVQSLSLRLNLTSIPEHTMYSTGFLYTSRMEILKFKMSKSGTFQDTQLNLRDGPNLFEIRIVGGIVDDSQAGKSRAYLEFVPGTEKGQTFLLIVNRF